MDIKFTKRRVVNALSYDWLKILISVIAGIVVWNLLFTMTATSATTGESFHVVIYDNVQIGGGDAVFLRELKNEGALSYDVLDPNVDSVFGSGNYSAEYVLSVRMATKEGDVIIADGNPTKNESGETEASRMQKIADDFYLIPLFDYLDAADKYLSDNGFVDDDGEIVESKIETYFRNTRALSARNYKRTYNTEEKLAAGVKDEIKRITAVRDNLKSVRAAIERAKDEGNDFLWYGLKTIYVKNEAVGTETVAYGINLGKLNEPFEEEKGSISSLWSLYQGGADGLVLGLFNYGSEQYDLQFESLGLIDYLIRNYSGYAE